MKFVLLIEVETIFNENGLFWEQCRLCSWIINNELSSNRHHPQRAYHVQRKKTIFSPSKVKIESSLMSPS